MNIVRHRRQAGRPLARLQDDMNDLFHRFFDDWDAPLTSWRSETWWPALDVSEQDDKVVVKAEMPGMKHDDIELSVMNGTLTINGEKKESQEDKGEGYYHSERRYGTFRRDIALPASVDSEKVEATYKDGVLTVTLPKTEQAKAKHVSVKAG